MPIDNDMAALVESDIAANEGRMERAIRDLTLLERVRAHPATRYVLAELREIIDHDDFYEAPTRAAAELALQLLSPGDAGRGEGK